MIVAGTVSRSAYRFMTSVVAVAIVVQLLWNGTLLGQDSNNKNGKFAKEIYASVTMLEQKISSFSGKLRISRLENATESDFESLDASKLTPWLLVTFAVTPDSKVVEIFGDGTGAALSPGHSLNDIVEVIATDSQNSYRYLPVQSTGNPFANLAVYSNNVSSDTKNRIEFEVVSRLKAHFKVGAFELTHLLTVPNLTLELDPDNPTIIHAKATNKVDGNRSYVSARFNREMGMAMEFCELRQEGENPSVQLIRCTTAESDGVFYPQATRIFSSIDGKSYLELAEIFPSEMDPPPALLTSDYFKKYLRETVVIRGDLGQSSVVGVVDGTPSELRNDYAARMHTDNFLKKRTRANYTFYFAFFTIVVGLTLLGIHLRFRRARTSRHR